jgi:hypothetical protein
MTDAWLAAEWLVSPDPECRRRGLAALTASDEQLLSPLVGYLLASRVGEPDLELRRQVVAALARCLEVTAQGQAAASPNRAYVTSLLAAFDRAQVERLLEIAGGPGSAGHTWPLAEPVLALLDRISNLGGLLTRVAADRFAPGGMRTAAVAVLGELGVIEALPALEGLKTRIEGQQAGQLPMAFAPPSDPDDGNLLQALNEAIHALKYDD